MSLCLFFQVSAVAQVLEIDAAGNVYRVGGGWPDDATVIAPVQRGIPLQYRDVLQSAADEYQVSVELLQTLIWSESNFDVTARSAAGAIGLTQLMPDTARELGVDPDDPEQNIRGGAAYLRQQLDRFDGDLERALAAYNAGPAQVLRHAGVPPFRETQRYVARNLERLAGISLARLPTVMSESSGETQ